MSGSGALAWQTGASRCSGDLTNERKHVGNQRCHKHDVVDVFVGLPACISIARVWQPEVDDLSPKRLVRQKELDSALQPTRAREFAWLFRDGIGNARQRSQTDCQAELSECQPVGTRQA